MYKDWREHQVLNEVRNQGRCNCSWAIAACTVIEALLKIKEKSIELVLLSPQDLINCNEPKKESDYDSCRCYEFTVNNAFRYIMKNGVRYERDCEFQGKRGVCLPHDEFTETVKIRGFKLIDDGDEKSLIEVVSQHPVAAAVKVSEKLENLKEDIYVGPAPYIDTDTLPSHTVVIVGYGRHEEMRMNYWIVMSSWGKKWGSGGFGRIARDSSLPPGSKPLLFRASFPLVD